MVLRCRSVLKHHLGVPKTLASVLSPTIPKEEEASSEKKKKKKIYVGMDAEVDMSEMKLCL